MKEEKLIDKILQEMNSMPDPISMSLTEFNAFEQYVELCILREYIIIFHLILIRNILI